MVGSEQVEFQRSHRLNGVRGFYTFPSLLKVAERSAWSKAARRFPLRRETSLSTAQTNARKTPVRTWHRGGSRHQVSCGASIAEGATLKIAYFVHDLTDPAVKRRVSMFKAGGAEVLLTGFRRGAVPTSVDGIVPYDLGQTADARFVARLSATMRHALLGRRLRHRIAGADVIVARNLEMLAIAQSVRGRRTAVPLVYECLDIHRLMLSPGPAGVALRTIEGALSRNASLLMTSSPAFVTNYFEPRSSVNLPVVLVENKVFLGQADVPDPPPGTRLDIGSWKIGWFGAIRCAKSFAILSAVTRRLEGRLSVIIRGRPAYSEFSDFDAMVAAEPFISFEGPYRNPDDLMAIYGEVDFAWVIDFFEEGLNSEWLLPNRLYESGWAGTIPIVRDATATGQWLARQGAGVRLPNDLVESLVGFFRELAPAQIDRLTTELAQIDPSNWICTQAECRDLVGRLTTRDLHGSRPTT